MLVWASTSATAASLRQVEDVRTMRIQGSIVVDADGKVVSHAIKTPVQKELLALLDETIPTWPFEPGAPRNGETVVSSDMELELIARGSGGSLDIRISQVQFPEAVNESRVASIKVKKRGLHIPAINFNGAVVVAFKVDGSGAILETVAVVCTIYDASDSLDAKARACSAFERDAARAAKRWKVTLQEPLVPNGEYFSGFGAISFHSASRRQSGPAFGQWRQESRTRYRHESWARTTVYANLNTGTVNRSDEGLRLRPGVVGSPL